MARAGQIVINISAGTAQFVKDIEEVKGGIRSVGKETANLGSVAQGTGFNIRYAFFGLKDIAEGRTRFAMAELANEMVRLRGAALGIGVAVVVVAAVAYAFTELGNKIKEANDKAAEAFRHLTEPMQQTNDELDVTNAKLTNDIALLEHKPVNRLAETLAEARVEADKLGEAIEGALEKLGKVLEEEGTGRFSAWLSGKTSTADIKDLNTNLKRQIREMNIKREGELARAVTGDEKDAINKKFDEAQFHKLEAFKKMADDAEARNIKSLPLVAAPDAADNIRRGTGLFKDVLDIQEARVSKTREIDPLKDRKQHDEDLKKGTAGAKRAAEEQLKVWEDELTRKELISDMSTAQEQLYWSDILEIAKSKGPAYAGVLDSIDHKLLEGSKKIREEQKQANAKQAEEQFKEWEDSIKAAQETSAHPAALRLQSLKESDPDFADERVQRQIPEAQKAADEESTKILKENLKEQDEAWHESSVRNAQEILGRATAMRNFLEWVRVDFAGIDALQDEQTAKIVEAKKAIQEEADKVGKIQIESKGETDVAANSAKKLQLEQQYATQRSHSSQEELAYRKQLGALDAEILQIKIDEATTELILVTAEGNEEKIAKAELDAKKAQIALQQQQLQLEIELTTIRAQHDATLKQGLDSFIHDANAQMKQPGDILKDGLNSALDQTSDNLTKLMTGQKTKWADEFKSIGREMVKESTKSLLTLGLDKLGLNPKKPLKPPTAIDQWAKGVGVGKVEVVNQQGQGQEQPGQNVVPGGGLGSLGGLFGSGSKGGGIFSMLGGGIGSLFSSGGGAAASGASSGLESVSSSISFPAMAGGGDVDPGRAYMVGEQGPEPFIPRTAGSIIPNSKLGSMGGGGNVTYSIDARGAELGAYNRIQRGIEAAHASAVDQSAKVAHERTRRTPQVSHA